MHPLQEEGKGREGKVERKGLRGGERKGERKENEKG